MTLNYKTLRLNHVQAAGELQEMEKTLADDAATEEKPQDAEVEKHAHLRARASEGYFAIC